jgi:hypothetical protein
MNKLLPVLFFFLISSAHASSFYFDLGGGISQYRNADVFAGATVPSISDFGVSANAGLFFCLGDGALEFHLGIQDRFSNIIQGANSFGIHSPMAMVRIQIARIFLSAGYTNMVFRRLGTSFGFDNFQSLTGATSYAAEVGFLFPLTPKFSIGLLTGGQYVSSPSGLSPAPTIDIGAVMRFHFGFFGSSEKSTRGNSNEYEGWRYPFGRIF